MMTKEEGLANIDEMIELHKHYITLLQKLKLGVEQHYDRLAKEKQNAPTSSFINHS